MIYVGVMAELGEDFDTRQGFERAAEILNDASLDGNVKADRVCFWAEGRMGDRPRAADGG